MGSELLSCMTGFSIVEDDGPISIACADPSRALSRVVLMVQMVLCCVLPLMVGNQRLPPA